MTRAPYSATTGAALSPTLATAAGLRLRPRQ
jgi:hypothetical protein